MDFRLHLEHLRQRQLISKDVIRIVLRVQKRLQTRWRANVTTAQMETALIHLAMALGRIQRACVAQPLHEDMLAELKSAVGFSHVLQIHRDILALIPFEIPDSEQTHLLANWYSLVLDQPWITEQIR